MFLVYSIYDHDDEGNMKRRTHLVVNYSCVNRACSSNFHSIAPAGNRSKDIIVRSERVLKYFVNCTIVGSKHC